MKLPLPSALLLLSLYAAGAWAQSNAPEATDAQVRTYRQTMDASCRDAGKQRGDAEAHVGTVCGCLAQVFDKGVTAQAWRQAVAADTRGDRDTVQRLLILPNAEQLRACATK
jgi:hypothetical protein